MRIGRAEETANDSVGNIISSESNEHEDPVQSATNAVNVAHHEIANSQKKRLNKASKRRRYLDNGGLYQYFLFNFI